MMMMMRGLIGLKSISLLLLAYSVYLFNSFFIQGLDESRNSERKRKEKEKEKKGGVYQEILQSN
jgi:hypothetical protein